MNDRQALSSEIVFLRIELDDRSSLMLRYLQALTLLKYKFHQNKKNRKGIEGERMFLVLTFHPALSEVSEL